MPAAVLLHTILQPKSLATAVALASVWAISAQAQQGERFIEQITIIGAQDRVAQVTGAAYYIGKQELEKFSYSDIQRITRAVPGVSIQVEDGFGLRPNISIRGVATERSSRITLLEDNILIAPAPYAAPAAYYFPTAGRMQAVEVVKGPAAITQGPYTIGGALNMVSTQIPDALTGNLLLEGGADDTWRAHATYGGYNDAGVGFLVETHQWQSAGFQHIDRSNRNSGLDLQDYTVKLAWAPLDSRHSVELKLQRAEQDSNQSYMGLTDADFARDALRRYGLTELDNITTAHDQVVMRYGFELTPTLLLSATAYRNEHVRDWYKLENIDLDGSAGPGGSTSWADLIKSINTGTSRGSFTAAQLQDILDGTRDTPTNSIRVRSNDREYFSQGLQLGLDWSFSSGALNHDLEAGIRFHADAEDRLQQDSFYQQVSGKLALNSEGLLGAAGNEVAHANALALHLYDRISIGNWVITPGLRHEGIEQSRTRYNGGAARSLRDYRENKANVWLPGLGVSYALTESLNLIAGVHKGFTAPNSAPGVDAEEALNYELGLRFDDSVNRAELIGFLSDYTNLLGVCTASSGSDCVIGDAFNGDAATVRGMELLLARDLAPAGGSYQLPLTITYTWIDGQFDTDIASTDFFGDVKAGDPIPYIPEQQWRLALGYELAQWSTNLSVNYIDEVCVVAACGRLERTDNSLTVDLAANYQLNAATSLYARMENLGGAEDIVGRHPYGARPNKDRTGMLGIRVQF